MKILITGSKGFVGLHLVKYFKNKHRVVDYDLKDGKDIFNQKLLLKSLKSVDVVIHLAAFISGMESWEKQEEYLMNNGLGTYRVIKACVVSGVKRIIIFSSAAVYGKPLTPYGASKLWGEIISKTYEDKIEVIIVRPFNIYGMGQNTNYGYVIHNFFKGIKNKQKIQIYGDGNQTRDFIFIGDVVKVVEELLTSRISYKQIDLGTGHDTKIIDLAHIIGKILNKKFNIKHLAAREEVLVSKADTSVLAEVGIDVSKFTKLKDGLISILK
ncbi:MAG: NAD-dependent epimerase/dehydratase family protein [Candidatus Woesebacteria bacterium]|nr:NAD-dependent epimerase/dehydratase family protein [Candidatus Woesebacteria bacterium]